MSFKPELRKRKPIDHDYLKDRLMAHLLLSMEPTVFGELYLCDAIIKNFDLSKYNLKGASFFNCKFINSKMGPIDPKDVEFNKCEVDDYQKMFSK